MRVCLPFLATGLVVIATTALYGGDVVDCSKKSLGDALAKAGQGTTISFTGVCSGPIVVKTEDLALSGVGTAVVDGNGGDAIVIATHGVQLSSFEVRNGANGVVAQNGAHISIANVTSTQNSGNGILLQSGSSAVIMDSTASTNAQHGIDLENGASATIEGVFDASNNGLSGVNANGAAITFAKATATMTGNMAGLLIVAGDILVTTPSRVNANGNTGPGISVSDGGKLRSLGGEINASNNGSFGLQVDNSIVTTKISTFTGNTGKDIQLTFGTRADLQATSLGSYSCDATVLVRGNTGISCPH